MRLFYFTVLLLLVTPLYAQQKVRVEVCDMQGIRLAYPELSIGNYFHRMGGVNRGRLSSPLNRFV